MQRPGLSLRRLHVANGLAPATLTIIVSCGVSFLGSPTSARGLEEDNLNALRAVSRRQRTLGSLQNSMRSL